MRTKARGGLTRGSKLWIPTIATATPGTAPVSLGANQPWGHYTVVPGLDGTWMCIGASTYTFGGGASLNSGTGTFSFGLPLPPRPARDVPGAVYGIGSAIFGRGFGVRYGNAALYTGGTIDGLHGPYAYATAVLGQWKAAGVASLATNGGTTKVITHGMGRAPDAVLLSPGSDPNLSTVVRWWVTTITATQFTINVNAQPTTNALSLYWTAEYEGSGNATILAADYPFAWGSNGDHFEVSYAYPIAA